MVLTRMQVFAGGSNLLVAWVVQGRRTPGEGTLRQLDGQHREESMSGVIVPAAGVFLVVVVEAVLQPGDGVLPKTPGEFTVFGPLTHVHIFVAGSYIQSEDVRSLPVIPPNNQNLPC